MPLPPGVTLRPIDGGPSYYADNGFTYAHNAGWDNPSFFPIASDYCFYQFNSTATFFDLGLNFTHRVTADTDLSLLRNAGIWGVIAENSYTGTPGTETIGWHVEEPSSWTGVTSQVPTGTSSITGRLLQCAFTWDQFAYAATGWSPAPPDGTTMPDVMKSPISTSAGNVTLNIPGADIYWCAGSGVTSYDYAQYYGGIIYNLGRNMTAAECARGCRYGDMVDFMRAWVPDHPAPAAPYIETEDGLLTGTVVREITPPEFNWAAWSTIIHGARWLLYFGTTSDFGSSSTFGFSTSTLPGQSVSMYSQAQATNGLVTQLAPVINSPTALGYFTVTPPPVVISAVAEDSGIDATAKYYTGGGALADGFYIFATTRESGTAANIAATFTTMDRYTGAVTVVGESRTVQAANGVFSDTFALGSTVHIYQIPYGGKVSYESVVLADDPSFLWLLADLSGSTAADATGNGNTGTYNNGSSPTTTHVPPFQSVAADFTTTNEVDGDTTLTAFQQTSAECWFNTTSATGGGILQYGQANFVVYMHNDGTLSFGVWTGSQAITAGPTASAYNDGNWHYVVATFNGSGTAMRLYVDAAQVATATASAYAAGNSTWYAVEGYNVTSAWPGTQSENNLLAYFAAAASYPTVLSPTQITAHYNAGIGGGGDPKYLTGSAVPALVSSAM